MDETTEDTTGEPTTERTDEPTTNPNDDESDAESTANSSDDEPTGVAAAIERVDDPVTVDRLVSDLRDLGVEAGDTLIVHASLSAIGYVAGGAQAVVDAMMEAVTAEGTLVMPTHSHDRMDPATFTKTPVPDEWIETIRAESVPYRPAVTPTNGVGAVPETFRRYPEAVRSRHPTSSFAAWGTDAAAIVADHQYDPPNGERSPLAAVYDRDGRILRIGTDANTSLHLAEHRTPEPPTQDNGAPILNDDGEREWITYEEVDGPDDLREAEAAFEDAGGDVCRGTVGAAETTLVSQPELVDFAAEWFEEHR